MRGVLVAFCAFFSLSTAALIVAHPASAEIVRGSRSFRTGFRWVINGHPSSNEIFRVSVHSTFLTLNAHPEHLFRADLAIETVEGEALVPAGGLFARMDGAPEPTYCTFKIERSTKRAPNICLVDMNGDGSVEQGNWTGFIPGIEPVYIQKKRFAIRPVAMRAIDTGLNDGSLKVHLQLSGLSSDGSMASFNTCIVKNVTETVSLRNYITGYEPRCFGSTYRAPLARLPAHIVIFDIDFEVLEGGPTGIAIRQISDAPSKLITFR